ncbi:MAG: response regulator transcription factor [Chloroflexi bacterium]|nr:response regulator transcription factor [Chloroflexota bacterium]
MAQRKKDLSMRAARFSDGAAPAASLTDALRALANGLFGKKKRSPTSPQEIADYYLTLREREVAYLAALGFSDTEIADALGMTFQTARAHLRSVLTKMDLQDPRDLCAYFLDSNTDS